MEEAGLMATEAIGGKAIHDSPDFRSAAIQGLRVIRTVAMVGGDLFGAKPENEDIRFTHFLADFDIGPIERADRQRAIEGEFHIAGPGSLRASGGDLLADVGSRDNLFRQRDTVIRNEDYLDLRMDTRVVIDDLANIIDQLDDLFG